MRKVFLLVMALFLIGAPICSLAGGVIVNINLPNDLADDLGDIFIDEFAKWREPAKRLTGYYEVAVYFGAVRGRSAIGFFVEKDKEAAAVIWREDLYSRQAKLEEARKAVKAVMERIKKIDLAANAT